MRRGLGLMLVAAVMVALPACSGRPIAAPSPTRQSTQQPTRSRSRVLRTPRRKAQWSVVAENRLPGTRAWHLHSPGSPSAIEGYADRVSVRPGQSFRLFVSTTAAGFRAVAYRMGWYGGKQGREVWHSRHLPGRRQPHAAVSPRLHTVHTHWRPSLTVHTNGWPVGDYLIKLISDAGHQRYVPITVRSVDTAGKVVLLNAVATWQAYNTWGGYDLYEGPRGFTDRSRAVSFDRPYDQAGIEPFLVFERPAVALAERLGLPLAYLTDNDLARYPHVLDGARALITLGHDEYWTASMRAAATRARSRGTNIAFLGANAVDRHTRLAATSLGPDRLIICYKSASEDPMHDKHPRETTQDWRLPPDPRPESALVGVLYDCFPADAPFTVVDPRAWLFAGTHVRHGTRFAHLVGPESDKLDLQMPTPRPIEILANTSFACGGSRRTWSNASYYTVKSGAGVFSSGTQRWVPALGHSHRMSRRTWRFVEHVTSTLLRVFAAGPAGRAHPAHDNAAAFAHGT